jgi:predicted ester cyclase
MAQTNSNTLVHIQAAKQLVWQYLCVTPQDPASASELVSTDIEWHCFHPINHGQGADAFDQALWASLRQAMPDAERRCDIFFAGDFDGRFCGGAGTWVTAHGYITGTFERDWMGIPATGEPIYVRIGEFYRVQNERIVEARVLLDFVDVMRQAGIAVLPPSSGLDILVPGPHQHQGLLHASQNAQDTQRTMQVLEGMIGGLHSFNQKDLKSMGMHAHWHENMMWYGPCGIGTSRRVEGFQRHHQKPFLAAFPDRVGGHHRARFAEGHFVASTGWPSVRATHSADYLGASVTHKPISMRVADWWFRDGDVLRENWVMIDLPELLLQMGVDLFARLKERAPKKASLR